MATVATAGTQARAPAIEEIAGGLSDVLLLSISLGGFLALGAALYLLVLRGSATGADDDEDGETKHTYEEELDGADVRTLNRAQRRARAKNRMKMNRRIAPERPPEGPGDGDGDAAAAAAVPPPPAAGDDDPAARRAMSRKDRAKAAKAAEREERRQYEEERREQQRRTEEAALRERKAREKLETERKMEARREQESVERASYEAWRTMFAVDEVGDNGDDIPRTVSVAEFVEYAKRQKVMRLEDLATHFRVKPETVEKRINELDKEGRFCGIVDDSGHFVYFSSDDLCAIADKVMAQGKMNLQTLAKDITSHINKNNSATGAHGSCAPTSTFP